MSDSKSDGASRVVTTLGLTGLGKQTERIHWRARPGDSRRELGPVQGSNIAPTTGQDSDGIVITTLNLSSSGMALEELGSFHRRVMDHRNQI
ncbi:uncharacterized protein YALI1_F07146g [Yarrowia lipolytica]|uniref:Uncharacterized protein n=1 Tax=Yarrowia lipolytica TaxID=4952 RepID=A0A1D8NM12_YARLL|nr:hypothetical protein YALI1_F07146g [Yarrowia lipolytica]